MKTIRSWLILILLAIALPTPIQAQVYTIHRGTVGDDQFFDFGTAGSDRIIQEGKGGNDTLYIDGEDGDDFLIQVGCNTLVIDGGAGDDLIIQKGNLIGATMSMDGGTGNNFLTQISGPLNNYMNVYGGGFGKDSYDVIFQIGNRGADNIRADGGQGSDLIIIEAGAGDDLITYDTSHKGDDRVFINGGPGFDILKMNRNVVDQITFAVMDEAGQVICHCGQAPTETVIYVRNIEQITFYGYFRADCTPTCNWGDGTIDKGRRTMTLRFFKRICLWMSIFIGWSFAFPFPSSAQLLLQPKPPRLGDF